MNKDLKREIEQMRFKSSESNSNTFYNQNGLNPAICILFRWFLAFSLFVCGVLFPEMSDAILPKELKELPVYISIDYDWNDLADFMDSMAN